MSNENTELLDAREFKRKLIARTKNKGDEEGQKIGKYLDAVVLNWKGMRATRLYKHVQDMLKNAGENKRFEMEIALKRATCIVPLMIIFFTAFGYLFYADSMDKNIFKSVIEASAEIDKNDDNKGNVLGKNKFVFFVILNLVASINAFLSFCLFIIISHGQQRQKNWEYHIDYLQAIFGIKLIRLCLEEKAEILTIRQVNILFGLLMLLIWSLLASGFSLVLFLSATKSKCEPLWLFFCKPNDLEGLLISIPFAIISYTCMQYTINTIGYYYRERHIKSEEKVNIMPLQKLHYDEGVLRPFKIPIVREMFVIVLIVLFLFFTPYPYMLF